MMFCRECGKEMHESALACPGCGAPQQAAVSQSQKRQGTLWLPVPALILGIFCTLLLFDDTEWDMDTYVGAYLFCVVTLVLGIAGVTTQEKGKGMSIAAIVLGALSTLLITASLFA